MCEYLYAAFSLRSAPGPASANDQLEVVERWRRVLFDIAAEEMMHWAVVQNLLTAVGSAPYVSRPHLPHQAKGLPARRAVPPAALRRGGAAALRVPGATRGRGGRGRAGFEPVGPPLSPMAAEEVVAAGPGLRHGGSPLPVRRTRTRPPGRRAGGGPALHRPGVPAGRRDRLRLAGPRAHHRPRGANRALERIVEQGEGATGDWASAHYGRFLGMLDEYLRMRAEDPDFEPAHPVVGRRDARGGGHRAGRLHHRRHHRRLLRPLQRRATNCCCR